MSARRKSARINGLVVDDAPKHNGVMETHDSPRTSPKKSKPEDPKSKPAETEEKGKKKKHKVLPAEMPMVERITQEQTNKDSPSSFEPSTSQSTKSQSFALSQAIQSNDRAKFDSVFHTYDPSTISATVRDLEVKQIIPLLKEIGRRFETKKDVQNLISWASSVLSVHMAYLSSCPGVVSELKPLHEWIKERSVIDLLQLQAKLQLMRDQIQKRNNPNVFVNQPPILSYQEESSSSDESDVELDFGAATTSGASDLDDQYFDEQTEEQEDEEMQDSDQEDPRSLLGAPAGHSPSSGDESGDGIGGDEDEDEGMDED